MDDIQIKMVCITVITMINFNGGNKKRRLKTLRVNRPLVLNMVNSEKSF